ncbi:carbohydrate esterase [Fictibacillus phosphorivorans]|uniref:Carbohydrate esterase n=1 Tax=Fictibacillus phosphorivorans TaxID=1221500 RepID=A0A161RW90_9BACL|nr:alpha/beta hydrolase-fold protein [Fictibacillus phosphorivorans]KZE68896.1 carbohydrate esterase [Fictibacillus phosphorivorans]
MIQEFKVKIEQFEGLERQIRVCLPYDYEEKEESYPVLYMHDGQNLFRDEDASYGVSWGLADFLEKSKTPLIIVGIDCNHEGFQRLNEYGPWENPTVGPELLKIEGVYGGKGEAYIEFLLHTLKPLIDEKYRTKPEETLLAGSSMGGLISTYAMCRYPHVFSRVASLSSAFWFNQKEIESLIRKSDLNGLQTFYMDIGTDEDTSKVDANHYIRSSETVYEVFKKKGIDVRFDIIEGGKHHESAWRERMPEIIHYLMK